MKPDTVVDNVKDLCLFLVMGQVILAARFFVDTLLFVKNLFIHEKQLSKTQQV